MTTRRRRAGSESYVEEPAVPGPLPPQQQPQPPPQQQQQQQPFIGQPNQPSYNLLPGVVNAVNSGLAWTTPSVPTGQAYYKKTDSEVPASHPVYFPYWNHQTPPYGTGTSQWNSGAVDAKGNNGQWNNVSANEWNSEGSLGWSGWGGSYSGVLDDCGDMASRDRTQEFARIVRSQQGSQTNGAVPQKEGKRIHDLRQYKDFMQRSKLIHRNISSTYAKLEKLTLLARKRSLFDDSHDRDIQELTGIIRHDLTSLTKQLGDLRNRSHVSVSGNNNTAHLQKHSSNIVGSLQTKVALITQKFKDVLEIRTENLKKQAERREQFTGGAVSGELPPGAIAGHHHGSVLLADEAAATYSDSVSTNDGHVAISMGQGGAYQQQLQLMEEHDTFLQSRADTMRTIESTIVELGQMFTQLATMVKEQEELVHRIDSNVEDAELNVEAAHSELLKYFKSVSSNRMLMIKVFGIMIVFFVIFVVFMA